MTANRFITPHTVSIRFPFSETPVRIGSPQAAANQHGLCSRTFRRRIDREIDVGNVSFAPHDENACPDNFSRCPTIQHQVSIVHDISLDLARNDRVATFIDDKATDQLSGRNQFTASFDVGYAQYVIRAYRCGRYNEITDMSHLGLSIRPFDQVLSAA
jgi:hypothetical protein